MLSASRLHLPSLTLRYLRAGSEAGLPVIFLHGIGVTGDVWRLNLPAFANAGFAVYAPDAPGFGDSDQPPGLYTVEYYAGVVNEFIETLGLGPVALVGNSMGGAIALGFALAHPEKARALILADPFGVGVHLPVTLAHLTTLLFPSLLMAVFGRIEWAFRRVVATNFYDPSRLPDELINISRGRDWRRNTPGRLRAGLGMAVSLGLPHQRRRFLANLQSQISAPTLIIWGENDRLLPVAHARELHAALPNSRLHIFPHCGHIPPIERAAEFNQMAVDFLKETGETRELKELKEL